MPIPGDNIQGMITAGKGVLVHRAGCRNVGRHRRRQREWVAVVWSASVKGQFQTSVIIELNNVPGALATVATAMSDMDTNIEDIRFERTNDKITVMNFILSVRDRTHLGRLIKNVRILRETHKVKRATS